MKKSLLFIAALCGMVAVNANTITLEPGVDKIKGLIDAGTLADGDVIELQTGTYTEWSALTFNTKVTIKAAEGATPIVKINKWIITKDFEANGIEFTNLGTDYMLRTGGDVAGVITVKNCTMSNEGASPFIYLSSNSVGSLVIDNCIFKDNAKIQGAVVTAESSPITNFTMTNTTIYNCGSTGDLEVYLAKCENALVDHCTFYNCAKRPLYINGSSLVSYVVKNCVISSSTATGNYCIATYAGTVDNCVYYNTSAPRSSSSVVVTGCINADPQFVDPDNGNFNFAFTSPLFLAATDGTNIGDPRWGVEEPETAIEVPGTLPVMDAVLQGTKISKSEEGIKWNDNSANPDDNTASWVIDVTKAGTYEVVVYENSGSGHQFMVDIANKEEKLETLIEEDGTKYAHNQDIKIGTYAFAESGKYLFRLKNGMEYSSAVAQTISVNYLGGAVVDVPASLPIEDAIINGPRVSKAESGLKWNNSSDDASSYVTWNVNVTKAGDYEVVVNENTEFGHNYSVTIENDQETLPDVGEGKDVWKSGDISLGIISIANTGVYTIKLTNTTLNSTSLTNSLSLNYIGGGIVNVPGILLAEDALLGGKVIRLENGSVKWPNQKDVDNHYVTWNINATAAGDVDVIAHIGESSSGHCFTASLYEGETLKSSVAESATVYTTGEVKLGTLNIPAAGAYTLRLTNAVEWSSAIVDALELKEAQVIETIEIGDDQTDVDFTAYAGKTVNIKLNRTIKADMFTPFCLPFALYSSALNSVLKSDKAYVLDDAQIQDQTLSVKLQTYSSIYQGTPFLIKPTEEVVDPIFENVTIMNDPQASSTTKGNVTFQGSFAKENLTESDKVLLVGNNNTLFYPNDATTPYIKSMRAYFRVNVEANKLPRFAAFVEPGNAPTEMIIVGGEAERQKGHRKVLVDGQIRIQHEGKCYSILGLER